MSMEGTNRAHFEGSGKKSKKGLKRKVRLDVENENAEDINGVSNLDEAVLNITGSDETQSVPSLKKRKKKEDAKKQVEGSREETQDNEQQRSSKQRKRVKFNLESSNMSSDQEENASMEKDVDEDPMLVQGNGTKEENELKKPIETTWIQKASWKSLVGETGRVNFSLGSVLGHNPIVLPNGDKKLTSMGAAQPSMNVQSRNNVSAWIEGPSSAPSFENSSQSNRHLNFSHVKDTSKLIKKSETRSDSGPLNHQSVRTHVEGGLKKDPQKFGSTKHENAESVDFRQGTQIDHQNGVEKVCRFMRSDNYEQEWLEAKRAVKDIFKRSRKDALRSMKMFHKKTNQ